MGSEPKLPEDKTNLIPARLEPELKECTGCTKRDIHQNCPAHGEGTEPCGNCGTVRCMHMVLRDWHEGSGIDQCDGWCCPMCRPEHLDTEPKFSERDNAMTTKTAARAKYLYDLENVKESEPPLPGCEVSSTGRHVWVDVRQCRCCGRIADSTTPEPTKLEEPCDRCQHVIDALCDEITVLQAMIPESPHCDTCTEYEHRIRTAIDALQGNLI